MLAKKAGFNCHLSKYYVTFSSLVPQFFMCKPERFLYYHDKEIFRMKIRNYYEVLQFCGSGEYTRFERPYKNRSDC